MRTKCFTCTWGLLFLLQTGTAQVAGLRAKAALTGQRTCHFDNEDAEEFKMDIFLANTGADPIILCDQLSNISLTPRLATTAENAQARQFIYEPNIDIFPSDAEVAHEAARVQTCRKRVVPVNGKVLAKGGEVVRLIGLHDIPATKSVSGPVFFSGDVAVRLPGAQLREWNAIPLDPLRILLPPYDPSNPRPYYKRRNQCEAWRPANDGSHQL